MGFDWASLAGPFAGLFGGGVDAAVSAKMARDNRRFQERMTRHRYRYQMEDMEAAGLNPILAFGQSPPGSPPGAMGKGTSFGAGLANAAKVSAEMKLIDAQARKTNAEADLVELPARPASALGEKWDQFGQQGRDFRANNPKAWDGLDWKNWTLERARQGPAADAIRQFNQWLDRIGPNPRGNKAERERNWYGR